MSRCRFCGPLVLIQFSSFCCCQKWPAWPKNRLERRAAPSATICAKDLGQDCIFDKVITFLVPRPRRLARSWLQGLHKLFNGALQIYKIITRRTLIHYGVVKPRWTHARARAKLLRVLLSKILWKYYIIISTSRIRAIGSLTGNVLGAEPIAAICANLIDKKGLHNQGCAAADAKAMA